MWYLYAVFLLGYSAMKYLAVPQAAGDPGYIRSTAIVRDPIQAALAGFGLVVVLCVVGYATFWYFFIPADPAIRPPLWLVARRGFLPGLVMGAIVWFGLRRRGPVNPG